MGINSVAAADLETNPSDHCRVARTVPGSLWIVRNTIFVCYIFRLRAAAVTPFIPGMLMSRRTISGLSLPTFSRASAPSWASPQTWKEFKFKSDRMAVRAAALSSTTSIRAGNFVLPYNGLRVARRGGNGKLRDRPSVFSAWNLSVSIQGRP
jgi:hypothetical protein